MEKLRSIIERYNHWKYLELYINRIEGYYNDDFSIALENAKSLLESISKQICSYYNFELNNNEKLKSILKKAFSLLGYSGNDQVTQISTSLANIGQQMSNLRNKIGATSHGRTLDELRERNECVDILSREFILDSTEVVACFLIRNFEKDKPLSKLKKEKLVYSECDEFNEYLDGIYGNFPIGDYFFRASEILFQLDYKNYKVTYDEYSLDEE